MVYEAEADTKDFNGATVDQEELGGTSGLSNDEKDMIRMGKLQQTKVSIVLPYQIAAIDLLQRNFGLLPLLGFTTIMLNSWESVFPFFCK